VEIKVAVITVSDKGSKGEREDVSGKVIEDAVKSEGMNVVLKDIIPDEYDAISTKIIEAIDKLGADVVLTTGGTGFSHRDVTPEATKTVLDREAPGFAEIIRSESYKITPRAMLSRGTSGIRGRSLVVNLPGSPKAVREGLQIILPVLSHGVEVLRGEAHECAQS
jgi:molybdopterin adenylyltransferase